MGTNSFFDWQRATTHTDLILRAVEKKVAYKIVHNASIMNAVGCCGLQLYNFGETVSIPLWTENWKPDSFIDKIIENKRRGLHTLCLLGSDYIRMLVLLFLYLDIFIDSDIKVKEKSMEAMMKGKIEYEPPRFMSASQAADQIIQALELERFKEEKNHLSADSYCIGLARVGSEEEKIVRLKLGEMIKEDLGKPLHSLVIEGTLHPLEKDMVAMFEVI